MLNPKSFYNFDSLMILLFFLWIIENDNQEDGECLETNGDYFLIFTVAFFKGALWMMSISMLVGTMCIVFILVRDIIFRVRIRADGGIQMNGGLTFEEINQLPKFKYNKALLQDAEKPEDSNEVCAICLCDFEQDETLIKLANCNHMFHDTCLTNWISKNAFCPYCRGRVDAKEEKPPGGMAPISPNIEIISLRESISSNTVLVPSHAPNGYHNLDV